LSDRDLEEIKKLLKEAYAAGLSKKSAQIGRRGAELASTVGNIYQKVYFLFWYGVSLAETGDTKGAQIALLEAARPDPEADPADQYNAVCKLISIVLNERDNAYCRSLIAQAREYLAGVRKEAWSHMLDKLEGNLEFNRGEFDLAYRRYQDAWDAARELDGQYPSFTDMSYVLALVETAFFRRDAAALTRWQTVMSDYKPVSEGDKIYKQCGLLFLLRAGCAGERQTTLFSAALGLLRHIQGLEGDFRYESRIALRALAVAAHWTAVDDWLPRQRWTVGDFEDQLFLGDERLCRARHALGIPARDDEWDWDLEETLPSSSSVLEPARRDEADTFLAEARNHYHSVHAKAEVEDHRLETARYTSTLKQRLARVSALVGVL
jgi:hypothetical protein